MFYFMVLLRSCDGVVLAGEVGREGRWGGVDVAWCAHITLTVCETCVLVCMIIAGGHVGGHVLCSDFVMCAHQLCMASPSYRMLAKYEQNAE